MNRNSNKGNKKKSVQGHEDQQQTGMQNQGKNPKAGMQGGSKVNSLGQGSIAGSTGTGNQGNIENPVSGN